jgi:long-chain acyl-CoA synthetase
MMTKETLSYRFWSHVFNTPEKPGVLLRDAGGKYVPLSWRECGRRVAALRIYLRQTGLAKEQRTAILGWNCPEWTWADLAIQSMGAVTVPIYPNTAAEQVNDLLADSDAVLLFADERDQLDKVRAGSPVKTVSFANALNGVNEAKAIDQEIESIRAEWSKGPEGFLGIKMDDLATFIYTSGSTGKPKGVMLTHGNIAAACDALSRHGLTLCPDDVALSYLPMAHVYERVDGQAACIWYGVPTAFAKTADMAAELEKVRPTILLGVPAVWRKMKDKIQAKLDAATGVQKLAIKLAFAKIPLLSALAGALVFPKVRQGLGGRLRLLMSGGAPISKDILEFFDRCGLPLREGYGLSETAGGLSLNTLAYNEFGTVGPVMDCCEVKIVPQEGAEDSESGEIWVRGSIVFKGYWKNPEETAKALTPDGWFKTGDLGKFVTVRGKMFLKITGRKKRLLKTDGGKYVAPEKIEKAFDGDPLVGFIVPAGDGKPFIIALVGLNEAIARQLLSSKGINLPAGTTVAEEYQKQAAVKAVIDASLEASRNERNKSLEHWETVKYLVVLPVEPTVANGLLTATLKIRSEEVMKRYKDLVEQTYASTKR